MALESEACELLSKLYFALDTHNAEAYAARFTVDGRSTSPRGEHRGRDAITEFIRRHIDSGQEDSCVHRFSDYCVVEKSTDALVVRIEIAKWKTIGGREHFIIGAKGCATLTRAVEGNLLIARYEIQHHPPPTAN